jgi:hypothetical protein
VVRTQESTCWLHLPNGDDVLIDGGKPQAGPTVVACLSQHGVTDIEQMAATHGDADHIGGLLDVLASLPVQEAWLDSQTCTTGTCLDFYQASAESGIVTSTVRMGESFPWGQVTALVLNPSEPLYASKNENSVVLRVPMVPSISCSLVMPKAELRGGCFSWAARWERRPECASSHNTTTRPEVKLFTFRFEGGRIGRAQAGAEYWIRL